MRLIFCRILLTCLLCSIFFGCKKQAEEKIAVPPVQTLVLGQSGEAPFRRFPGEVTATDSLEMSFEVSGRLIEFPATQGMSAAKGELLGQLDQTNFTARWDAARADYVTARDELTRRQQLHQRGVISRSELDQFQRNFDLAEAALRTAQRALDDTRLSAPFDGRVARTLANNFQNIQAHQPVLVFQSNASLEITIHIPESDMSLAEQGITIQNASQLLEAFVEFPTLAGQRFPLQLKSFSTEASPATRTFEVSFLLDPSIQQNILPGMTCTVLLRLKSRLEENSAAVGVFAIPARALATSTGEPGIWKIEGTPLRVARVPVELIGLADDTVQVRSEHLEPGDEIVTSGVRFLSEGMEVRRLGAQ